MYYNENMKRISQRIISVLLAVLMVGASALLFVSDYALAATKGVSSMNENVSAQPPMPGIMDSSMMPGGTRDRSDYNAPKTIKSEDMTYFKVSSSFIALSERPEYTRIFAYAAKCDAGVIASVSYSNDQNMFQQDGEKYSATALVPADVLKSLNKIVKDYDFAKNNGHSHYVNGLPDNFGGSVVINYASDEYICFDDNQSSIISPKAGEEIVNILKKFIEERSIRTLNANDIVAVTYHEDRGEDNYALYKLEGTKLYAEDKFGSDKSFFKRDFTVPADAIDPIRKKADTYALLYWKGLPESELSIYDISKAEVIFTMKDGTEITVKEKMRSPASNVIFDIHMYLNDLMK